MPDAVSSVLAPWSNFYVMIGSASAALTGLMFVVITLMSGIERLEGSRDAVSTFSTPTVVHFSTALFVAATVCAPWHALAPPAVLLGLAGLGGVAYVLTVMLRTKRLTIYQADFEDWACYTILPLVGYGALLAGGVLLPTGPDRGLFVLAGGVALLIFIGIRNAWDGVTYLVLERRRINAGDSQ
jgi:hypothetical protein